MFDMTRFNDGFDSIVGLVDSYEERPHFGGKQLFVTFCNGYEMSIVLGNMFYSNGVDTYEVAVFDPKDEVGEYWQDAIKGHQTFDQVMEIISTVASK